MINKADSKLEHGRAPVYIPFKTFQTALETLELGIPPILDRSVWPSFSGGLQSQTLGAFKFLGLIGEDGAIKPILESLVSAKGDARKTVLQGIIRDKYAGAIQLAEKNASFQQLQDYFRVSHELKGGTLYRIIRFFLDACAYAGEKCSTHWAKAKKTIKRQSKKDEGGTVDKTLTPSGETKPNVTTVKLASGGSLLLSLSVDLMALTKEDRDWLFGLIDQLKAYGQLKNEQK